MIAKTGVIVMFLVSEMNTIQIYIDTRRDTHRNFLKAARVGTTYLAMPCLHCSKSLQDVRSYTITCVACHINEHNTDK